MGRIVPNGNFAIGSSGTERVAADGIMINGRSFFELGLSVPLTTMGTDLMQSKIDSGDIGVVFLSGKLALTVLDGTDAEFWVPLHNNVSFDTRSGDPKPRFLVQITR